MAFYWTLCGIQRIKKGDKNQTRIDGKAILKYFQHLYGDFFHGKETH